MQDGSTELRSFTSPASDVETSVAPERPLLQRLDLWSWWLLCLLLPIDGRLVPVPLVVALVLAIAWGRGRWSAVPWRDLWPFFVFYALHVLGMAWTTDTDFGLFDLQVKAGLVLLPIAAALVSARHNGLLRSSMLAFTAGCAVAVGLGVGKAAACHGATGQVNCFSQSGLSYELHPSYAAWYICWCIAYWGIEAVQGRIPERWLRIALAVVLPMLLVFSVMLASKSGVIGLGLVLLLIAVLVLLRLRGALRWGLLAAGGLVLLLALALQGPLVKARMDSAWHAAVSGVENDPAIYSSADGSALRMVAWTCSCERLALEPFGAGTGDIKHALMECYEGHRATEAAQRNLNSHSQFLQGGVALGWPGLLCALLLIGAPLVQGARRKYAALIVFGSLACVNALVESVLEVQAGVLFFALFLGLLLASHPEGTLSNTERA